jgi:cytochrome bd ubiquinol oxidase subunit II
VHLYALPLIFALAGLAFYAVLAGADFGAGFWELTAGRGERAQQIRDHAHAGMAPVWEANHVWLVFVLTVVWTAYPTAFGSIASTLAIPLFVAGIGIVLRGGAYAMRSGTASARERRAVDLLFSLSSILTPFALGTAIGGIASQRVPVGNATGSSVRSWLNPTSVAIGILAVTAAAYSAAVFLSADAARRGDTGLAERFRLRALGAGLVAGAVAIAGLIVLHFDAGRLFHRLVNGPGLIALVASLAAGVGTLTLVWRRRYEPARYTSALAVTATIAGWALAQQPVFLPGLSIKDAAAPHDTEVAVVVAVLGGAVILFPSLALLFRLTLAGRLTHADGAAPRVSPTLRRTGSTPRLALASLIAGIGFLTIGSSGWAHALGVICLLVFVAVGYRSALPADPGRSC